MSTYLSPIVSSGDSTPIEQQQQQQQTATNSEHHLLEYPTRELKITRSEMPTAVSSQAPPRRPLKTAAAAAATTISSGGGGGVGAGKKSIRSMGNSMVLNESSESDLESQSDSDSDDGSLSDNFGHRNLSQSQRNRLRFMAAQSSSAAPALKNGSACAAEQQNNSRVNLISQQEVARSCTASKNQCLADKFVISSSSSTAAAAEAATVAAMNSTQVLTENNNNKSKRSSSSASSSSLINCSDNEMNSNNSNHQHHHHLNSNHHHHHHHHHHQSNQSNSQHNQHNQFHHRILRSANKVACDSGEKLNKKFSQILQSLPPMVPLVATTSVMTILVILCCILLLTSDSLPMRATAKMQEDNTNRADTDSHSNKASQMQVMLGSDILAGGDGDANLLPVRDLSESQMQSLVVMDGGAHANANSHSNSKDEPPPPPPQQQQQQQQQESAIVDSFAMKPVEPALELKRELISELFARHQLEQARAGSFSHRGGGRGHHRGVLTKSKRGPERSEQAASAAETAGLFDSLGAMLFGAGAKQRYSTRSELSSSSTSDVADEAAEQDEGATAYLDGGPSRGAADLPAGAVDSADGSAAVLLAHRPAHLRSSALEIDLSPSESRDVSYQRQQQLTSTSQIRPRQAATSVSHGGGGGNSNKHQRAAGNRHQQHEASEQQQSGGGGGGLGANHERPFDVAQIQCNNTEEGFERFACPTPDLYNRYKCIEDRLFCDGYYDCPGGEDEERVSCMYYKLFISHIDILTNTFLTWMKSQNQRQAANGNNQQQQHNHHHRQQQQQQQQQHLTTTNGLELGTFS